MNLRREILGHAWPGAGRPLHPNFDNRPRCLRPRAAAGATRYGSIVSGGDDRNSLTRTNDWGC
jgi:hypothetical protein